MIEFYVVTRASVNLCQMDHWIQEPAESCGVLRESRHPGDGVPQQQQTLCQEVRELPAVGRPEERIP